MPNHYFQFRQFRIEQEGVAMKVTTEGCILGAWVYERLEPARILDIGTGTGLLALMMAQKFSHAWIDAVELDRQAFEVASSNVKNSPWANRISVLHQPIQTFRSAENYDLIIVNPPFFNRSLTSGDERANLARHDASLSQQELVSAVSDLLSPEGTGYILYPEREATAFQTAALAGGFFINRQLAVYNKEGGDVFRVISKISRKGQTEQRDRLVIKDSSGGYTGDFARLLRPFYLNL